METNMDIMNYYLSSKLWISNQKLIIEMNNQNIDNAIKMIDIYTKSLELFWEAKEHEDNQLKEFQVEFDKFIKVNNLDG